ncbi:YbjN domain-containing protein [Haliangium sp.]|uniref:YbjN domain-containing protein n=1 Tax=Haliangium sp. TaxID=2663208 RepID=UPI003D0FFB07
MTLFADGREANIKSTVAMVEDVLLELGHFVNDCRQEPERGEKHAWQVERGSATVRIALGLREDAPHLSVVSTVLTLDDKVAQAALFRRLLTLNRTVLCNAAFALDGAFVQILGERPTLDLDRSEVLDLIRRIEFYADEYDDRLVTEFGGIRGRAFG